MRVARRLDMHRRMWMEVPVYIDPNTGGMLFQILAVLFGAISGMVLIFSSRIKMFFAKLRRRFRESGQESSEDGPDAA